MKKKLLAIMTCLCMLLTLLPAVAAAAGVNPFADVKESDWYYNNVLYVYEQELMKGISSDHFDPNGATTRGQIVAILYRLEGSPEVTQENPFKDVGKGFYYETAITWAAGHGIVSGYSSEKYGPDDSITREQMASILYRYAKYKGYNVEKQADLTVFEDLKKLSDYAKTAMAWANGEGLISGFTATRLEPQGNAVRAQAAAILHRFCVNIVPEEIEEEHIHVWGDVTIVEAASQDAAGVLTYECTGCKEAVTAVWAATDEQFQEAIGNGAEHLAIMDGTLRAGEFMHLNLADNVHLRMAGMTMVQDGAGIIVESGNVYIDELILDVVEPEDGDRAQGAYFANMGNVVLKDAIFEDGIYYGMAIDDGGEVYPDKAGVTVDNLGSLKIIGNVQAGCCSWMYNEGHMLISSTGKLRMRNGEVLETGYYYEDEEGVIVLEPSQWDDERDGENWYDGNTGSGFDNLGEFDVNGTFDVGECCWFNNGDWGGANEDVITNVNGTLTAYGSVNNMLDGAVLNVNKNLEIKENGYLGNDGIINVGKDGKILLDGNVSFDNSDIGQVAVDGIVELAGADYQGICEYVDEWGNVYGVYDNTARVNNNGTFTVNGSIEVKPGAGITNHENAELTVNGTVVLEEGNRQESGYFAVEEDGKVSFTPGDMNEEWGGEYYDEETDTFYRYYDEWTVGMLDNNGEVIIYGTVEAAGINNNAYSYEDENGFHIVQAQITVEKGGTLKAIGWMNNNSDWYDGDGEIAWTCAEVTVAVDAAFELETLPDENGSYENCLGAYLNNYGRIVVDGVLNISKLSTLYNGNNECWMDLDEDGEHELVSANAGELVVNGKLDMTDIEVFYETYYEEAFGMDIDVPVDQHVSELRNDGFLEINGRLVEKVSNFESNGTLLIGEDGVLEFDSFWCDFNADGIDDTFIGNDAYIHGDTYVNGEMLNHRRVVCNWGEGTVHVNGKLTMDQTGDLYIGEYAGFVVGDTAEIDIAGGRILINDREDASYDEDGNVVEWYGTISKHIEDDFDGIDGIYYNAIVGSYDGFLAAIDEENGFDNCDLTEGEYIISENMFIRTGINIYDSARLIVEDGVKVIINNVLYNYMGECLELQGDAFIEIVGNTTGEGADHRYAGYEEGFDISEDEKQPAGSDFAYKTTIRNAK